MEPDDELVGAAAPPDDVAVDLTAGPCNEDADDEDDEDDGLADGDADGGWCVDDVGVGVDWSFFDSVGFLSSKADM